jgi:hypothetical protein
VESIFPNHIGITPKWKKAHLYFEISHFSKKNDWKMHGIFLKGYLHFLSLYFSSQWKCLVHLCFTQGRSKFSSTFPNISQSNAPNLTIIMCVLSFPSFTICQHNLNVDALGTKIVSSIYLLKVWNLNFKIKDFVVEYLVSKIRIKLPQFYFMFTSCERLIDFTSWIEHLKYASTIFCCPCLDTT